MKPPKSVEVGLDLKFIKISGTWEPNNAERQAAYLDTTRAALAQWAALLAVACGFPDLAAAMPTPLAGP